MQSPRAEAVYSDDQVWPTEGLERVEHCPVCGSSGRERLHTGLTDRVFRCAPGHWDLNQCLGCRSAYLDPRPTTGTIHLAYQSYYTHRLPKRRATQDLSPLRRLRRAVANGYLNRRYQGKLQPANPAGAYLLPLLPQYRQTLDRGMRHLPALKPGARLLDVGFGNGEFLESARKVGWRVAGVDPDPVTVENARRRGLDVRVGGIEAFSNERETFDVVTFSHVIEHVHDPCDTVREAFALLKPSGTLYLETPNVQSIGHSRYGRNWRGLEPPRHLVIFSWDALEKLLVDVGFEIERRHVNARVYPGLAAKSRAIEEDRDPYQAAIRPTDRIRTAAYALRLRLNYRKSEFIALTARKPRPSDT